MFGQPAATGGFGHQRTSTSLFTPASTAPSTANPSFSLSSTATNPINPGSTATNTLSTFGTGLTTSAPSLGAAPAPSTFGSSLSTPAATPFGSAPKPALGLALNTTANTQSTLGFSLNKPAQPATGSLFGTAGTSSFNPVTQAQQQQQPQKLLSLDHAFPDTNIPFYSFSMDKSTRIAVPPQLRRSGKPNSYGSSSSLSESMRFDDKRTALPSFFDGSYSKTNDSTSSGKKRSLETENTRNVVRRSDSAPSASCSRGIFADMDMTKNEGFDLSGRTDTTDGPPIKSMWDVGFNPKGNLLSKQSVDSKSDGQDKNANLAIKGGTSSTVKIFGYSANTADLVYELFAKCGSVVSQSPSSEGNWMTIEYATQDAVQRALDYNGKILENNQMIGVIPSISPTTDNQTRTTPTRILLTESNQLYQRDDASKDGSISKASEGTVVAKIKSAIFGW